MGHVKSFSGKEAVRFGWETTKKNFWFLIGVMLLTWGVQFIPSLLSGYVKEDSLFGVIISIVVSVVSLGLTLGSIKIYLSFVDSKKPQFSDLFSLFKIRMMWRFFLAETLYVLMVLAGLILFIIPGIYLATKYVFMANVLVDKNAGVFESLVKSGEITKGIVWKVFVFQLLLTLIALVGLLALGVGLLVACPVISLADMYLYRKLSSNVHKS